MGTQPRQFLFDKELVLATSVTTTSLTTSSKAVGPLNNVNIVLSNVTSTTSILNCYVWQSSDNTNFDQIMNFPIDTGLTNGAVYRRFALDKDYVRVSFALSSGTATVAISSIYLAR